MSGGNYVGGPAWASQRDMDIAGAALARGMHTPTYGAIAYSHATGRYGWSYKAAGRESAEKIAIDSCGAGDATILVWSSGGYLALALGDGRSYGSAWDADRARAEALALEICRRSGSNCHVALIFDTRREPKDPARQRFSRRIRAVILSVIAVVFAGGALYDLLTGYADPRPGLVIAVIAGLAAVYQARPR